jgi:hypothetical protein
MATARLALQRTREAGDQQDHRGHRRDPREDLAPDRWTARYGGVRRATAV